MSDNLSPTLKKKVKVSSIFPRVASIEMEGPLNEDDIEEGEAKD